MEVKKVLGALTVIALGSTSFSCGRDTGYLYEDKPVQQTTDLGNTTLHTTNTLRKISWLFPCETSSDPMTIPTAGNGELVLQGPGPHVIERSKLDATSVQVSGQVCPPGETKRDIVIVIDISGSMMSNDPEENGSCGRLQAFNAVLDSVNWNTTMVGALTFDDQKQTSSKMLFATKDELVAKLTNNNSKLLKEVLCAEEGSTNYEPALREAEEIFEMGREGATKEMFFLTDGEPFDKRDAENKAEELKTTGVAVNGKLHLVTMATIMLGEDDDGDEYLRDNYPSLDVNKDPIHANVKDADKLAETLKKMSGNNMLAGSFVKHGASGVWTNIDLMPILQNYKFEIPEFYVSGRDLLRDYEVQFEYWDAHTNRFKSHGKIMLKD